MGFILTSNPQFIYKQTTTPEVIAGGFWYKTDTKEFFTSDGVSWAELSTDTGFLNDFAIETALEVLELQAAGTITSGQGAYLIRDIFSDADGYLNTIDEENTTANFSDNSYKNTADGDTAEVLNCNGSNSTSPTSNQLSGVKVICNKTCKLGEVTILPGDTATILRVYLRTGTGAGTLLEEVPILSEKGTFSTILRQGNTYLIVAGVNSGTYEEKYHSSPSYPKNDTNLSNTGCVIIGGSENTTQHFNINTIATSTLLGNVKVQTEVQTLSNTPTKCQLFAWKDSTAGTGSISADVSFDDGAHYQTMALDTATDITDTGTQMILKLNLNAGASSGTAEIKGYGVMFW